ncbi:MAG TPA: serine/threonine-protein kinase [Labilithrix sp.]
MMPVEQREGAVLAGRFRLDRRLGEGGMGVVWAATNTTTGRRVAIKMLRDAKTEDPHVRRRFLREGKAASKVQHPNVVEILDVLELEEQTPAIVMEYLEGESLGQRIRRDRQLDLHEAAAILMPAVAAVGAAHSHGVVHRDLKPDNIFLAKGHEPGERVVKVLDFGIAKIATDNVAGETANMTGTGAMLGTPYYMAPEQLFSDETLDYRCDIWALGVILYECISGRRPTQGDNFADIVKVIATQKIVPFRQAAPNVPAEIGELVERMLSFDKESRPQSLREVRDVLRHYTDVMASTFGEPVLKPVKQSRDADESGQSVGLRKSDVALLLDDADTGPSTAATLDAPASLGKLKAQLAQVSPADTHAAVGVGLTAPPPKKRGTWRYVAGGAAVAVALGLGGMQAMRTMHAPAANAAPPPVAVEAPPTAKTTAETRGNIDVTTGNIAPAVTPPASASAAAPIAKIRPAVAAPTAKATATAAPTATAAVNANAGAGAPGGLVEKPPF